MALLIASGTLTSQQAFDQLRTASQHLARRLHVIAADVALNGQLRPARLRLVRD